MNFLRWGVNWKRTNRRTLQEIFRATFDLCKPLVTYVLSSVREPPEKCDMQIVWDRQALRFIYLAYREKMRDLEMMRISYKQVVSRNSAGQSLRKEIRSKGSARWNEENVYFWNGGCSECIWTQFGRLLRYSSLSVWNAVAWNQVWIWRGVWLMDLHHKGNRFSEQKWLRNRKNL